MSFAGTTPPVNYLIVSRRKNREQIADIDKGIDQ